MQAREAVMNEPRDSDWKLTLWVPGFQYPFTSTEHSYEEACKVMERMVAQHPDHTGGTIREVPRLPPRRTKRERRS